MAVIRRMSSKAKVGKLENYLKQETKTEEKLITGMNCDSDNFAKQCEMTNLYYRKNQEKNDRKYYHIIQSFSPKDNCNLTYEEAHKIGRSFAEKNFRGHEVLIITHKDKEHIHNHFVVNSVNLENGKKYRADNKSLWKLRRTSNELCIENGLVNSIQELGKRAKDKLQSGELRKALRGEDVWKLELRAQIKEAASISKSEEEFKQKMKDKYNVIVTERTRTSKGMKKTIYEYQPKDNKKPCGEHRLGEEYGKEFIRNGIARRSKEETRGNDTSPNGAEQPRTDTNSIENAIRNRQVNIIGADVEQRERELKRADNKRAENRAREEQSRARSIEPEKELKQQPKERTR
jgi:hypothetical protein